MKRGHIISMILMVFFLAGFRQISPPTPYTFPKLSFFPPRPVAADNPVTVQGALLGRYLFYEKGLSADSSFSCGSCHRQQSAFADAPTALSVGINGSTLRRNTMPLFNLAWYNSFFWDGKAGSLEEQVFHPVRAHNEMNLKWTVAVARVRSNPLYLTLFNNAFGTAAIDSMLIARAIAQFERTLISSNSKYDQVLRGERYFTAQEYEGFVLMNDQTKGDCLHCHTTDGDALGTTGKFSNNGLQKAKSMEGYPDKGRMEITGIAEHLGQFKIPSLRNVALTAPYMHDGRFSTLSEVLDFYSEGVNLSTNIDSKMGLAHKGGVHLTPKEKASIIAFLHTLTDSTFINNPEFSNPF